MLNLLVLCITLYLTVAEVIVFSSATPLPPEFAERSTCGSEFHVGVIAELSISPAPLILVTTDDAESVNFTLSVRDPQFRRTATVDRGSIVSIPLPRPSLSSLIDSEGGVIGIEMRTQFKRSSIKVFLSPDTSDLSPTFPCGGYNGAGGVYSYHVFPAVQGEQPLARSTLLLVGCQDATLVQVFSTDTLSLPVSLNYTRSASSDSLTVSFVMDQLDTVAIPLTGDIARTHLVSDKPLTVTVVSTTDCFRPGFRRDVCGSSYTQVAPSLTWGRRFLVASRPGDSDGAEYMMQTGVSLSTAVLITCSNSTHTNTRSFSQDFTIERATSFVFKVSSRHYCSVESEQQVQLVQYSLRTTSSVDTIFPLVIPPIEQYAVPPALIPLQTDSRESLFENGREFGFHATIFVSASNETDFDTEGKRVLIDGELVSEQWHNILCRNSRLCGYVVDVPLPLQSSVNITHENEKFPISVLVHRVGANPFSYPAAFRLNDLTVPVVYLERASYTVLEEDLQLELSVVRDGNFSTESNVLFTTEDDTALGGVDYLELNGTLRFLPGERAKAIVVTILDDLLLDENETFNISISSDDERVRIARGTASVTITDSDALEVGFERESYTVDEVTGRLEVNITSSAPFPGPLEVVLTMTTIDGTAEAPDDYFPLNLFLLFTPGIQYITVTLHAFEDLIVEPELEQFSLSLGVLVVPAGSVSFTRPNATVFIEDSNTLQVELVPSSIMIAEDGGSEVTVAVSSSGDTVRPVTVFLVTSDLTATAGEDYVPVDMALTFTGNQTSFEVVVKVLEDSVVEGDETVLAEVVVPEGESGVSLQSSRVVISIIDDDSVVLMFSDEEVTVTEADGKVDLTIIKSGTNSRDVLVTYTTLDGNAIGGEDYTPSAGSLVFSPADTSTGVQVVIRDDSVVEYQERFIVALSVPDTETGVVLAQPRRVVVTISNDDSVEVGFAQAIYTVLEGAGQAVFMITKSGSNARDVEVTFATEQDSATSPGDFEGKAEIVTFGSVDTTLSVSVPIVDDTVAERLERFRVTLIPTSESVAVSVGRGEATVEIADNDFVVVGFSQSVYMVREGEMAVGIRLNSRGTTNLPITVIYSTQDDTATAGEDYVSVTTESVTFSGKSGGNPVIRLRLIDNSVPERTEQLRVLISLPPLLEFGLILENTSTTILILDNDDVRVRFDPELYSVSESSGSVSVRVVLLGETSNTVAVTLRTLDQEAMAPGDYSSMMISLVFQAGEREKMVAVPIADDRVLEDPQSFSLELSALSTGVAVDGTSATVVIEDNDVISVGFEAALIQTQEDVGNVLVIGVELSDLTEVPLTVSINTQDNTATVEEDYALESEDLVFVPGVFRATLSVEITPDSVVELTERFLLVLVSTNDSRVEIDSGREVTAVEIEDTTESPCVSVVQVRYQNVTVEVVEGEGRVVLALIVSGELQRSVNLIISTRDGSATAGDDYIEERAELTVPAGENEVSFELQILNDEVVEKKEYFSVDLSSSDDSVAIATPTANVTILEDDSITVMFETTSYTVNEREELVVVTATMVGNNSLVDVTVLFGTVDGTAIGIATVADYIGVEEVLLTFGPSQLQQSVEISIIDDPALENTESFTVTLSPLPGETRVAFIQLLATVSILDNDEVALEFGQPLFFAIEGEPVVFLTVKKLGISYIDIPFTLSTQSATATVEVDFVSTVPAVTFRSYQQLQFVPISILDDQIVEGDEFFTAALLTPPTFRGVKLTSDPANISILDNDFVVVRFEPAMYTVMEGDGEVTLTASVEGNSVISNSLVIFTTSNSNATAEADEDYNTTIVIIDVHPNDTLIAVTVPVINDDIAEGVELFTVAMASMSEFLLTDNSVAIVQIIDSNGDVVLRVGFESMKYTVAEREGAVGVCLVSSVPVPNTLSFLVYTEERSAQGDGVDFVTLTEEVTLFPGQQRVCVSITIVDDRVMEGTEDLILFVESDPMNELIIEGLTIAPAFTDICITDNDSITIGFEREVVSTVEGSSDDIVVKVIKVGSTDKPVSVAFTTEDGTAESGVDYEPLHGVLIFSATETEKEIVVSVADDGLVEGQEHFFVVMSLPMSDENGVALNRERVRADIEDDDMVLVEFEAGAYVLAEDAGELVVCLTKDKMATVPISLSLTPVETIPPSATESEDFISVPVAVTIPTSSSTVCTELHIIIDDSVHENSQHFQLNIELDPAQPYVELGSIDHAEVTILDNDVVQLVGVNKTVAESDGEVEVCLEMDRETEIPVSVNVTFTKNTDPAMTPAQGGIDFDSTPRILVFEAGERRTCIDVDIFPDAEDELAEQFTVVVTSSDNGVRPPSNGGPVITITDDDRGTVPATLKCKALDSVVIEPFPSPTATLDSFSYHNPCEHTLLTTCSQSNNKHTLRVTVNFSPSNLDLRGLAISINRTRGITIFRNSPLKLNNLSDPLFSNATHSLYDGGVLIIQQEQSVTVVLQEIGVQISRNFGVENSVEILVLDDVSAVDVCGLCGTVNGRLLFSDRTTEAESLIDSAVIEEFANSWSVNPLELLLGQQPEECGVIRNDTIVGDPLFTVPLDFPSTTPAGITRGATPHLCFEVHGERESVFNLISDRCTSVNALFTAMTPPLTGNIVSNVAITAIDYRGGCINIEVSLQSQCMPVIYTSDGTTTSSSRYSLNGVSVRRHQHGVRVAVPNCENTPLVLWVLCESIRNTSMIKFVISRGVNLRPTSHGLLGQFWNIPVSISPMTTTTPASLTLDSLPPPYILTLSPPLSRPRQFIARLYSNTWDKRGRECFYAGSAQGGPLGELESPQLRDSVIEGRYTDYRVNTLFDTEFTYTQFNSRECTNQR